MIDLFPDQVELIDAVKQKLIAGNKSVMVQAGTGSGKTYVASNIVKSAYDKGRSTLFIVPRKDLIRQTSATFKEFGIPHSFVAAERYYNKNSLVQIASKDTLKNRLDVIKNHDLTIVDEAHYGGAGLDRIIQQYKPNTTLLGLTATPWDAAGKGMKHQYEDMVCGKSIKWLIDNKRLSEYRAFAPTHLDLSQIGVVAGDYNKKQLAEKMEADVLLMGNMVEHYKDHAMHKRGVTFCVRRKHSEQMAQAYRDKGVPAVHMDGDTPEEVRIKMAKAFARREILQLCCSDLLTFGYDLAQASGMDACIEVMSDGQPTKSKAKQKQKNGRNLRYDGTTHLFFDHANNFDAENHGLPCRDEEWSIEPRIKKRKGSDERLIPVKECPECKLCHSPAPVCPYCDFVYPIEERTVEQIDVELKEIEIKAEKKLKRMEVGMAKTMADLVRIADERNYSRGWIFKMAQLKKIKG